MKKTVRTSLKYHEMFDRNVMKTVSKSNKLILGHTHIPIQNKYYINCGTWHKLDKVIKEGYCIISDLHIGGKTWNYRKDKLRPELIKLILKYKEKLILNGDIFELWVADPKKLVVEYSDIVKLIIDSKCIYIKGNHDYDISKYCKIKTVMKYIIGDWKVEHGWDYDPMSKGFFLKMYYKIMIHIGDNLWWVQKKLLPYRNWFVKLFWKK